MGRGATWSLTLLIASAFLGLTAVDARASCGDYLRHGTEAASSEPPPAPCHGPQCSERPQQPAAPVTALPRILNQNDGLTPIIDAPPEHESGSNRAGELNGPLPCFGPADEIFHPPRPIRAV